MSIAEQMYELLEPESISEDSTDDSGWRSARQAYNAGKKYAAKKKDTEKSELQREYKRLLKHGKKWIANELHQIEAGNTSHLNRAKDILSMVYQQWWLAGLKDELSSR